MTQRQRARFVTGATGEKRPYTGRRTSAKTGERVKDKLSDSFSGKGAKVRRLRPSGSLGTPDAPSNAPKKSAKTSVTSRTEVPKPRPEKRVKPPKPRPPGAEAVTPSYRCSTCSSARCTLRGIEGRKLTAPVDGGRKIFLCDGCASTLQRLLSSKKPFAEALGGMRKSAGVA